jgi:uncharacterized protein
MRDSFFSIALKTVFGTCLCLSLLAGCSSSPPSRFYVLSPVPEGKAISGDSCPVVGIGPISLPDYTKRLQVVTRSTQDEVSGSQFELWAEPLSESVPRTIAADLSRLICTKEIVLFPWATSRAPDYRVEMEIVQMDGSLGGALTLEAWWRVSSGGEKKTKIARKTSYRESVQGGDYLSLVRAHSKALETLSRDIAAALKEVTAP